MGLGLGRLTRQGQTRQRVAAVMGLLWRCATMPLCHYAVTARTVCAVVMVPCRATVTDARRTLPAAHTAQVPAIVALYAGLPGLVAAVDAAVRAQQDNDVAVGAAVAAALILEKVVLVGGRWWWQGRWQGKWNPRVSGQHRVLRFWQGAAPPLFPLSPHRRGSEQGGLLRR